MLRMRRFAYRVLNYLRPTPVTRTLTIDQILADHGAMDVVERFTDLYYRSGAAGNLIWRDIEILKNPCDIWSAVELFQRLKPRVIVETGTHKGGSALLYSDMAKVLKFECTIVTIDPNPKWSVDPSAEGIVSIRGYSTEPGVVAQVETIIRAHTRNGGSVMVFLDSDHSEANVAAEMRVYAPFVTVGSYLVVEDGIVNGHPSFPEHGPGPWEAIEGFLGSNSSFVSDRECERFLLTFNPRGWLRRTS